jgi:hypothetical protein
VTNKKGWIKFFKPVKSKWGKYWKE